MDLSLCFITTEYFGWGRYGGIGMCTRSIAEGLASRGVEVHVILPKGDNQKDLETINGVNIHSHPLLKYPFTKNIYIDCESDIYHSQEPSWGSIIAKKAIPEAIHVTTCQNPKTQKDWRLVERYYPFRRKIFNTFFKDSLKKVVGKMERVYCQAKYIIPKTQMLYELEDPPIFLPNPVDLPIARYRKSDEATICFLGRLDGEKRPELFFDLAKAFPDLKFVTVGKAHDAIMDRRIRRVYSNIDNLQLVGFKERVEKSHILGESWIMVNTSISECLPLSFLEAAAHRCAILSYHDPDGFSSKFGYHVKKGCLKEGLEYLLKDDNWVERGERGYRYVCKIHERSRVIDEHLDKYREVLES
jgi:glycosyltransferase involved in cell wall biosynthesis